MGSRERVSWGENLALLACPTSRSKASVVRKKSKKRKVDRMKNPLSADSDSDSFTTLFDSNKIQKFLEPYSKEQLREFISDIALSETTLLCSVAGRDVSHRKIFVQGFPLDTTREKAFYSPSNPTAISKTAASSSTRPSAASRALTSSSLRPVPLRPWPSRNAIRILEIALPSWPSHRSGVAKRPAAELLLVVRGEVTMNKLKIRGRDILET